MTELEITEISIDDGLVVKTSKGPPYFKKIKNIVISNPSKGNYKIINIFVNAENGKLVVQYDDVPI